MKEEITSLNDAKDEVELSLEDNARLKVGEVFMVMSQDDIVAAIESQITGMEEKQTALTAKLDGLLVNLAMYKKELYGKFGTDNISLED